MVLKVGKNGDGHQGERDKQLSAKNLGEAFWFGIKKVLSKQNLKI